MKVVYSPITSLAIVENLGHKFAAALTKDDGEVYMDKNTIYEAHGRTKQEAKEKLQALINIRLEETQRELTQALNLVTKS
jgi:hypothetical protein